MTHHPIDIIFLPIKPIKKRLWRSPAAGKKGYSFFRPCAHQAKAEKIMLLKNKVFLIISDALASQSRLKMCHRHIFHGVTHGQSNLVFCIIGNLLNKVNRKNEKI